MTKEYLNITKVIADFDVELRKTELEAKIIAEKRKLQKDDLNALVIVYEERGDIIVAKNDDCVFLDNNIDAEITEDKDKVLRWLKSSKQVNELFDAQSPTVLETRQQTENLNENRRERGLKALREQEKVEAEYREVLNDLELNVTGSRREVIEKGILSDVE